MVKTFVLVYYCVAKVQNSYITDFSICSTLFSVCSKLSPAFHQKAQNGPMRTPAGKTQKEKRPPIFSYRTAATISFTITNDN